MKLMVDGDGIDVPRELVTWGDLHGWIETQHLKTGQCITQVEFGGQEEFHYRGHTVCEKDLQDIATVDITSGEFDAVVEESLAELETAVRETLETMSRVISLFADGKDEEAYLQLSQMLESIQTLYIIFSEDLGWVDLTEADHIQLTARAENIIHQLGTDQENRHVYSIFKILEHELTPVLEQWLATVKKTRGVEL